MAKKKKKKAPSKKSFDHMDEIVGVLLVLASILGIGKYGPVGRLISSFSLFLVGSLYMVLLVVILVVGCYLIVKREWPNFFTTKLLGLYLAILGFLILMHKEFIVQNDGNMMLIFKETINQLVAGFNSIMNKGSVDDIFSVGGGIIGGSFAILFDKLFSYTGMEIVSVVIIGVGILLFTGFSIIDIAREKMALEAEKLKERKAKKKEIKKNVKIDDGNNDEEVYESPVGVAPVIISNGEDTESHESEVLEKKEKKIIISSIKELTGKKEEVPPVSNSEVVEDEVQFVKVTNIEEAPKHEYVLPPIEILNKPKKKGKGTDQATIEANIIKLENVLKDFGVIGKVVEVHVGPTVTQYELEIKTGTKVSKILSINREISLALAKKDVRIEAPIPGKNTIGIELANDETSPVGFREVLEKIPASKKDSKLLCPLGKNIMGNVIWCEIDKTPHLLVAGATGSGKSVCINGIIASILMRAKPDEVKLVMVDPKKVELSGYNGIPHLMCPVVTDPKKASVALAKMVAEMERRYDEFSETKTKNIKTYNAYVDEMNKTLPEDEQMKKMPYIVIIVDELADLMLVASKDVEASIMRITQMARAAGIHLIIATQRPSTDVITGVVKANIPSRISFAVSSSIDSRTILDMTGAEKLLGKGDMLFLPMGESTAQRVQGAYIDDDEIKKLIDYTIEQQKAEYDPILSNLDVQSSSDKSASQIEDMSQQEEYDDPLYNEIVEFVIETQKASASLLQRRFKLGYNRAARIIDLLEERGIIGPQNGSKPREVLVTLEKDGDIDE